MIIIHSIQIAGNFVVLGFEHHEKRLFQKQALKELNFQKEIKKLYAIFGVQKPDKSAIALLEDYDPMMSTMKVSRYQKWNILKEYKRIEAYVEGKLVIFSPFNSKKEGLPAKLIKVVELT